MDKKSIKIIATVGTGLLLVIAGVVFSACEKDPEEECIQIWDNINGNNSTRITYEYADMCCKGSECVRNLWELSDERMNLKKAVTPEKITAELPEG